MFSVRTRFFQNAVVTFGTVGLGQNTGQDFIERRTQIGNYFDNTSVFIGKYIGQDMFVQGMITMKYDENNRDFGGLIVEPDIGIELQSPFLNIRWNISSNQPENFRTYINSITLSWSKSF